MHEANTDLNDNPLLKNDHGLPSFDRIRAEHVVPAVRALLHEFETDLSRIEARAEASWRAFVEPIERIRDRLDACWGVTQHLLNVRNDAALREAHSNAQGEVVRFAMRLSQSAAIYDCARRLHDSDEFATLDEAQQRIIDAILRRAEHSGVALPPEQRKRFEEIQTAEAELSTRYQNNVLDATKAFRLELTAAQDVEGLPPSVRARAAQSAREAGVADATPENGPWHMTLDLPSYGPFMEHSPRRDLRERLHHEFITRASVGEHDNSEVIRDRLRLRAESARLLGFSSYAEYSLDAKMAESCDAIAKLTRELKAVCMPAARRDLEELREFARAAGAPEADDLKHWDLGYWSERLRESKYAYTDEELRPYFPMPQVLDGLFDVTHRLFDITIEAAPGTAPVWNDDVSYYRVRDRNGEVIASFYLDPYTRPAEKRGGAWMDGFLSRTKLYRHEGIPIRLPVACLVCNQSPPIDGKPSLMSFNEVLTMFHEFGHGLQHMLTRVDYGLASGIRNVEWDAVELPSQFMENWCYHPPVLRRLARHYETGAPLPEDLLTKIIESRNFGAGSAMLRQLCIGTLDLELHNGYDVDGDESLFDFQNRVKRDFSVLPPLDKDRFLCTFGHIFAGGYAAGYYSYKWAEVLSADAFSAFEEAGLDDDDALRATGKRFRDTVLSLGGGRHPMLVFKEFRGREPSTDALLRHSGLMPSA